MRRLSALVQGLPADGALARSLDPHWRWTHTDDLLILVAQLLDHGNRLAHAATQKSSIPPPIEVRRPWEERPEPKMASVEELRSFLGAKYMGRVS